METQHESIDISQLKAFALGLDNDLSQMLDPSPVAAASKQQWHSQRLIDVADVENAPLNISQLIHSTRSQQWLASQPHAQRKASRETGARLSASQPELPGTIPESLDYKMITNRSQSQGDTQPVSQWVYEHLTNTSQEHQYLKKTLEQDGGPFHHEGGTTRSIQPGETGHVDLLGAFEEPSTMVDTEGLVIDQEEDDIDPLSQAGDIREDQFPVSRRFQQPNTPATHSKKRKRGNGIHSQEAETPKLPTNPFAGQMGSIDGLMDASQLFKATQALTSPLVITSDGLSERPSPDLHHLQRPSTADSLSSPVRMPRAGMTRAVTEPQTTYISMQASQEAREKLVQAQKAEQILSADHLSDDGFGSMDTQLQRYLNQRKLDIEAKNQFAGLTARLEPATRGRGRRQGGRTRITPSRVPPRKAGRQASEPVLISDDGPEEEQGNVTEDETEREEEVDVQIDDEADELGEENKENVEVPRTVSRAHYAVSQVVASQSSPSHRNSRMPKASLQTCNASPLSSSPRLTRSQEATKPVQIATQPDAIADSQPSQPPAKQMLKSSGFRASSEPHSSLDARVLVPHSQSSDGPRSVRAPESTHKASSARASSLNPPITSPNREKPQEKMAIADSATAFGKLTAGERATLDNEETIYSRSHPPDSEGPTSIDHLHTSHDIRSSPTLSTELSTSHLVPGRGTVAHTVTTTAHHHYTRGSSVEPSNSMPSPRTTPKSTSKQHSSVSVGGQSHPSTLFETAQEHPSDAPSKTHTQKMGQKSQSEQVSPSKSKRPRSIREIAAIPSPPDPIGEIDVDINILSNEDIEFQSTIGGTNPVVPARKRRRRSRSLTLKVAEPRSKTLTHLPGTPVPPGSSAISWPTPVRASSEIESRSPAMRRTRALQLDQEVSPTQAPSDQVLRKTTPFPRATRNSTQTHKRAVTKKTPNTPAVVSGDSDTMIPPSNEDAPTRQVNPGDGHQRLITAPNRVFAHFNGTNPAYHPATCLEVSGGDNLRYTVRFDDGTIDIIGAYGIKRLELLIGDVIKVDLPGARTKNYVFQGMCDQHRPATPPDPATPSRRGRAASTNDAAYPETDVHGYATVLAVPRQRSSVNGDPSETFAITNIDHAEDSERVKNLISSNGGLFLENGFDELFHIPPLVRTTSPKDEEETSFHLTSAAQDVGFTCLIADKHCRRAKYVQALALGIPCLATRYVSDCVSKQCLLPWAPYLLPAGDSAYLGGVARSRVLPPFSTETATLFTMIESRRKMLEGSSILLIMEKGQEETMKQHPLIAHALGASRVARAISQESAAKAVNDAQASGEPWDWVFSYDKEDQVEKRLFGGDGKWRKRKRGRDSEAYKASAKRVKGGPKVVGNEFVIQSLILGMLVDE
ncbi:hypothetical protein P7C71_g1461, partial [Lecanoromycetidae sp. Uapishka_2]